MIRFYKKIQRFNWKYAVGEITLIFIGITLAIWVNNWNARAQDKAKEQQYLKNLREDLIDDIKEYDKLIAGNKERIRQINLLNETVKYPTANASCDSIQKYIAGASFVNVFTGSSTVFADLKSTGNLILIKNNELKRKILQYYEHVQSHQNYEDFNTRFHINTIGPFLKKDWNVGGLIRLGNQETAINNNFRSEDCKNTKALIENFQRDKLKLQELINHTSFSGLLLLMNSGEYELLKKEANQLVELIHIN